MHGQACVLASASGDLALAALDHLIFLDGGSTATWALGEHLTSSTQRLLERRVPWAEVSLSLCGWAWKYPSFSLQLSSPTVYALNSWQ